MSAIPTPRQIRELLDGYGIDTGVVSGQWIANRRDRFVIPWVEAKCRTKVAETEQVIEYLSGTGSTILQLSRRNIVSLDSIEYVVGGGDSPIQTNSIELIPGEGILKSKRSVEPTADSPTTFSRGKYNIKVVYTVGDDGAEADEMTEAVAYLCAEQLLGFVASRTGGGDLTVQSFGRGYGNRGKYSHIRNDLARQGVALLRGKMSGVVAS